MIKLTMSQEFLADVFTPGVLVKSTCTKGLPTDVTLTDISFNGATGLITCSFEDGQEEDSIAMIEFTK